MFAGIEDCSFHGTSNELYWVLGPILFRKFINIFDSSIDSCRLTSFRLCVCHQVSLNELSVVFCGLLERESLWEHLQTVPLRLELLWRHTTPLVSNKRFNQMEIDRYIHHPNLVNIIKQSGNPFALPNPLPTKFAEVTRTRFRASTNA